jgi:hypothetical protein
VFGFVEEDRKEIIKMYLDEISLAHRRASSADNDVRLHHPSSHGSLMSSGPASNKPGDESGKISLDSFSSPGQRTRPKEKGKDGRCRRRTHLERHPDR